METGIHQAKTKLSELISSALDGEEVIITKYGKPLVKLVPLEAQSGQRPLGAYAGKIKFCGDLLEPISPTVSPPPPHSPD